MYKNIYIHDCLCEIYNFSFTAETVFLSFFLGPFVFLLFTWSCSCVKNAVEDFATLCVVSFNFVTFLSFVTFFSNASFSFLSFDFLEIPGFNAFSFSFFSLTCCFARCLSFFFLLARFMSVFVLSALPIRSLCGLAVNADFTRKRY